MQPAPVAMSDNGREEFARYLGTSMDIQFCNRIRHYDNRYANYVVMYLTMCTNKYLLQLLNLCFTIEDKMEQIVI